MLFILLGFTVQHKQQLTNLSTSWGSIWPLLGVKILSRAHGTWGRFRCRLVLSVTRANECLYSLHGDTAMVNTHTFPPRCSSSYVRTILALSSCRASKWCRVWEKSILRGRLIMRLKGKKGPQVNRGWEPANTFPKHITTFDKTWWG